MGILSDWYAKEPEGWSELDTVAQVETWKSVMEKSLLESPPTIPIRLASLYKRGVITLTEFNYQVFHHALREENVDDFLDECPPDVLNELTTIIAKLPGDDDESGWPQFGSSADPRYPNWLTDEFWDAICKLELGWYYEKRRYKEGVRVLRKALQLRKENAATS